MASIIIGCLAIAAVVIVMLLSGCSPRVEPAVPRRAVQEPALPLVVTSEAVAEMSRAQAVELLQKLVVTNEAVAKMSRAQVCELLQKLEEQPAPASGPMYAMCYYRAMPQDRIDYVCPKCGERTLYTGDQAKMLDELQSYCRCQKETAPVILTLDESALCAKCTPATTNRQVSLTVICNDGFTNKTENVKQEDLIILRAFLMGATYHGDYSRDLVSPLKDYMPRLQQLLGVAAVPSGKKTETKK